MKIRFMVLGIAALFLSAVEAPSAWANGAGSVIAQGKVFYRAPGGEIVKRDATLEVPARGEGEVVLRGSSMEARSTEFKVMKHHGQTIFVVMFQEIPGMPGKHVLLKGTYLRGSNEAVYYGDFYKHSTGEAKPLEEGRHPHPDLTYAGGFYFRAPITGQQ